MQTSLSRKEIESHSSALTNQRISRILITVTDIEMNINSLYKPSVQDALQYYAAVFSQFMETSSAHWHSDLESGKKINEAIIRLEAMANYIRNAPPNHVQHGHIIEMIRMCKHLRHMMHTSLQFLDYFFRIGSKDPKGIKETLMLFGMSDKPEKIEGKEDEVLGHNE